VYGGRSARRRLRYGRAQGALMSHHRRRMLWICGRRKKGRRPQTHRWSNSSKQALTEFVMASNASPRLTLTPIRCQKSTGQLAAAPPGGIIPESRATSPRNGGRHHPGIPGRFRRNPDTSEVIDEALYWFNMAEPGESQASANLADLTRPDRGNTGR
jgi:hypothetical protein